MSDKLTHLLPCPFCGCTKVPKRQGNGIGDYWLECFDCGASTRLREDGAGMEKDWNRRASPAPAIPAVDPVAVPRALLASLVDDVEEYAGRHSFREREQEVRAREIARARVILAAPAISESEDTKRLDWLTDRLEDAVIDGADPAKYLPDDVGDGNKEGAAACRRAWRLAIDAARKGEKS